MKVALRVLAAALLIGGAYFTLESAFTKDEPRDGSALPYPDAQFKGTIGPTIKTSKPDFPPLLKAPEGAPNVLLILTDDVGFGASSTFGGPIPTPAFDKLAQNGLRYLLPTILTIS